MVQNAQFVLVHNSTLAHQMVLNSSLYHHHFNGFPQSEVSSVQVKLGGLF